MKKDRRPQESASPIETLRLQRTKLSQAEFAVRCGIPLRTYQRWVLGETEAKPTPRQWKAIMQVLEIQSLDEVPDNFGPIDMKSG
ncbi:helix-turn-helix transcriptional regulator [Lusitaniella coriacea LEGE 07157]|uniref:Helix-turn-helix transcriptional regulator n=2 Tax=Lusitaniella TaxID=1983104 RepID=A0A8J7DV82_9CYAN|nr:helix-turn-helix transcriptional regulator [Lusitaniella coriacea]MBE9115625.1 helix-turn-helix transcriptional regulator [Lusitaniella coriacea LEGE 07157]